MLTASRFSVQCLGCSDPHFFVLGHADRVLVWFSVLSAYSLGVLRHVDRVLVQGFEFRV